MNAKIFEIKRFAVHDGNGIRTTVFFKGCPLKCVWCHNPEGIDFSPELAFYENKCIGCGECISVCPVNAHSSKNGIHTFNRKLCVGCGKCSEVCLGNALTLYGESIAEDELLPKLLEDKEFYENSNGGVTLSGGECLTQSDFCRVLLQKLKENGINTAVDTCGFVPQSAIDKVLPYTDFFLYDIKAFDEDVHIKCTGYSNSTILDNIKYIDRCGKAIEVRIPYVPNYNSNQIEKISVFLKNLKNLASVRILPYHNYAGSKYSSLDKKSFLPTQLPTDTEIETAKTVLRKHGLKVGE